MAQDGGWVDLGFPAPRRARRMAFHRHFPSPRLDGRRCPKGGLGAIIPRKSKAAPNRAAPALETGESEDQAAFWDSCRLAIWRLSLRAFADNVSSLALAKKASSPPRCSTVFSA